MITYFDDSAPPEPQTKPLMNHMFQQIRRGCILCNPANYPHMSLRPSPQTGAAILPKSKLQLNLVGADSISARLPVLRIHTTNTQSNGSPSREQRLCLRPSLKPNTPPKWAINPEYSYYNKQSFNQKNANIGNKLFLSQYRQKALLNIE